MSFSCTARGASSTLRKGWEIGGDRGRWGVLGGGLRACESESFIHGINTKHVLEKLPRSFLCCPDAGTTRARGRLYALLPLPLRGSTLGPAHRLDEGLHPRTRLARGLAKSEREQDHEHQVDEQRQRVEVEASDAEE